MKKWTVRITRDGMSFVFGWIGLFYLTGTHEKSIIPWAVFGIATGIPGLVRVFNGSAKASMTEPIDSSSAPSPQQES